MTKELNLEQHKPPLGLGTVSIFPHGIYEHSES